MLDDEGEGPSTARAERKHARCGDDEDLVRWVKSARMKVSFKLRRNQGRQLDEVCFSGFGFRVSGFGSQV